MRSRTTTSWGTHDKVCKGRCRTPYRALWSKLHSLFLRVRIDFQKSTLFKTFKLSPAVLWCLFGGIKWSHLQNRFVTDGQTHRKSNNCNPLAHARWGLIIMINQKIKILHIAFLYCTGLRSSNITHNSVLSQIFDTARNVYCIPSDEHTALFFMVVGARTDQASLKAQITKKKCM